MTLSTVSVMIKRPHSACYDIQRKYYTKPRATDKDLTSVWRF